MRSTPLLFALALSLSSLVPAASAEETAAQLAAARSRAQRSAFARAHPCPATGKPAGACPGYVVDHVIPLACGGADLPLNMQWQTVAEGKAKDRWERKACTHSGG